jgi:DNA repair exonuclease SbcCD ATPase subunit
MDFKHIKAQANPLIAEYRHATLKVKDETKTLAKAEQRTLDAREAQDIIQKVAQVVQEKAHKRIASVVSRCLELVYDDPYTFKVIFERKRGKTEARLVFVRDDIELDPTTAAGGGPVDVAAFALRLVCLLLQQPMPRKLLVLDEPFRFVGKDKARNVRQMLELLSKDMNVQFVLVTHTPELQAGKVVVLE